MQLHANLASIAFVAASHCCRRGASGFVAGCRSAGRNLKSFKQIGHRRVDAPCDDLQGDNSCLALATFNVRQVSPVHVEMDGEIICA